MERQRNGTEGKTDARFAAYLSPTTNDTNECLQVLGDVVVLRNHPTSTIKENEVEDSATNGQVDGISHERTSGKVKTGRVGELRRPICRIGSIRAVTLDLDGK